MSRVAEASKDDLVLAALAVLGGESRDVNERDAFLICWHAVPNTMRWVDTALPNPETFTASLRRLEQRGHIRRLGKQQRASGGRKTAARRKTVLDAGRSGVVKARVADGGLEKAGVTPELVDEVRRLVPDATRISNLGDSALIVLCVGLREEGGRDLDEGALVEVAFHKFPSRFAFNPRPEFPDTERIRGGFAEAQGDGLVTPEFRLTQKGSRRFAEWSQQLELRLDKSTSHESGDLKFAARIERSPAYEAFVESGTLVRTKPDELFRMLRVPPTTNPRPVADVLQSRLRALTRIDKAEIGRYLIEVARRHNPDVADLIEGAEAPSMTSREGSS
jgi:hypothetical protein